MSQSMVSVKFLFPVQRLSVYHLNLFLVIYTKWGDEEIHFAEVLQVWIQSLG